MKMRKIISLLLALVMVCSIIPFAVFAEGETTATITFDDAAKRTEFTTEKQVWTENGVTVTNEKAASTSNVADYKKPARFYASSSLKIEFANMTKLVVNLNSGKPASGLTNSLTTIEGITVTTNGYVVTIEFAEPTNELYIEKLDAQIRVDSMTVTAAAAEEEPAEPVPTEGTVTFDDAAKRTEFTTEKQVWTENGVTVTNEKAASTSNVADYKKPARFYASSSLKIEFANMTKLVVNLNSGKPASGLTNSLTTIEGITVTTNGYVVTIEFAEPTNELYIEKLDAQIRVDSMTAYGFAIGGTTPEQPEQPEEPVVPETLAEQIAEANKLANGAYLPYESTITGTITDTPQASSYNEGQYKFTVSDGTNTILCYYTPVVNGVVPAKGDTATVTGKLTAYNSAAQFDSTASAVVTKNETPEQPEEPKVEYAEIADGTYLFVTDGKAMSNLAENKNYGYPLFTEVTVIEGVATGYANTDLFTITNVEGGFTIQDSYGRYYYLTGTFNSFNVSADMPAEGHIWQAEVTEGGVLIVNVLNEKTLAYDSGYSSFGIYSDKSSAITLVAATAITEPEVPEEPVVPETLAEQIEEANKLANGEYLPYESTISGTIIDEPTPSKKNEGQYKFTVSDGTNTILCYYTPVADGVVPAKGDSATVVGKLTAYNGTAQFDETAIAVVVNNVPEQPEQPGTGDQSPETNGMSIAAMAVLCILSGSALVLLKKKEF